MKHLVEFLRSKIRGKGYDINYFGRFKIIKYLDIDLILDVGANKGQFAKCLRVGGYSGRIKSYEPLESAYNKLKKSAKKEKNWDAFNFGLGNLSVRNPKPPTIACQP